MIAGISSGIPAMPEHTGHGGKDTSPDSSREEIIGHSRDRCVIDNADAIDDSAAIR